MYYSLDKRFVNTNDKNEFLKSLAFGGHQVGELAKAMYRFEDQNAIEVYGNQSEQLALTAELIKRDNVTLFEPTFLDDNLLARVDILKKRGKNIDLIEVKSIAWDRSNDSLVGKTPRSDPLSPAWRSYVFDVAFQYYLLQRSLPALLGDRDFVLRPWLLLLDKMACCSVNGLAFNFPIVGEGRAARAQTVPGFDIRGLAEPLLIAVDAMESVSLVLNNQTSRRKSSAVDFETLITRVAEAIKVNAKVEPIIGTACKSCEFYCDKQTIDEDHRSGWTDCMSLHYRTAEVPDRGQSIFALYRRAPIDDLVAANRLWLKDVDDGELGEAEAEHRSLSLARRHQLQRDEGSGNDGLMFLNMAPIRESLRAFQFPLHFIDFETARPALPYYKSHHPYQMVLFQFSHHVIEADGRIRHASEFLQYSPDESPSINAVRALRKALGGDNGTVLHWYPHERTVLREIAEEIVQVRPADEDELIMFLKTLGLQKGSGRLFDFGRLMEEQVFIGGTGGSSSMKRFLPAVLRRCQYIQETYSKPIYGTAAIPSKNFKNQVWIRFFEGEVCDPYSLLDPLFTEPGVTAAVENLERTEGSVVANGAAAMIAFEKLVRGQVDEARLEGELRRYCELDTLGMVFVYEWLKQDIEHVGDMYRGPSS